MKEKCEVNIKDTLATLEQYEWSNKGDPRKQYLCVKEQLVDGRRIKYLSTVEKRDVTCLNVFLSLFKIGKLAHIQLSLNCVSKHVMIVLQDNEANKENNEFIQVSPISKAFINIKNIYQRTDNPEGRKFLKSFIRKRGKLEI